MNERQTLKINNLGHLEIGGVDAKALKEQYGTPLYVMDQAYIEDMCKIYADTLKKEYGDGMIAYASKAFSCLEIYRIINKMGIGADSVSAGEMFTAKTAGFPMEKICLHGNNKSSFELEYAVQNNVGYIVLDSYTEASELNEICKKYNKVQKVLIRVNPGIEAHTHHFVQTAKVDSKFGYSIGSGEAEKVVCFVKKQENLDLVGLHCHIGSQIFEYKSFELAVEKMTDFYKKLSDLYGYSFDVINIGGGFGVWYADGDAKKSCNEYAEYIKIISGALKRCVAEKSLKKPYLILEPGRSIVGEAGVTLYTAGRTKEIKGIKNYIAIDGGMFDNPRYALYQAKYSVVSALNMNAKKSNKYTIAGKCCESGDIIAEDVMLPEIKEGDLIAVLSTGAYNYSMSSNYNRNLIPPVVMVKDGESRYIVKPQTFEDLIRNDV
ncbi:MAG: diaminopimelate decarboxylase [Clostridiales bacterium]|nr:diaminopimelate decarboxylase [Clostridiales bacterium]